MINVDENDDAYDKPNCDYDNEYDNGENNYYDFTAATDNNCGGGG